MALELPGDGNIGCLSSSYDGLTYITRQNIIIKLDHDLNVSIFSGIANERGYRLSSRLESCFSNLLGIFASTPDALAWEDDHNKLLLISGDEVEEYAGSGEKGFLDGPKLFARFNSISSITMNSDGLIFLADTPNNLVRIILPNGLVTSIGSGRPEHLDGNFLFDCSFWSPYALCLASDGSVLLSCIDENAIRVIDTYNSQVTTYCDEKGIRFRMGRGPMGIAPCTNPRGLACSSSGCLYLSESTNDCISKIDANGASKNLSFYVNQPGHLAISPDGKQILVASWEHVIVSDIPCDPPFAPQISFADLGVSIASGTLSNSNSDEPTHPCCNFEQLILEANRESASNPRTSISSAFSVVNLKSSVSYTLHRDILILLGKNVLGSVVQFVEKSEISHELLLEVLRYIYGASGLDKSRISASASPFIDIDSLRPQQTLAAALQEMSFRWNVFCPPNSSRQSLPCPIVIPTMKLSIERENEITPFLVHDWMVSCHFPYFFDRKLHSDFPPSLREGLVRFLYSGILGEPFTDYYNISYLLLHAEEIGLTRNGVPPNLCCRIISDYCNKLVDQPLTIESAVFILKYRIDCEAEYEKERLFVARNAVSIFRSTANQQLFRTLPSKLMTSIIAETMRWHDQDRGIMNCSLDALT